MKKLTPIRAFWKAHHRLKRVFVREQAKAISDMLIFGVGALNVPAAGDDPCHVPLTELNFPLTDL